MIDAHENSNRVPNRVEITEESSKRAAWQEGMCVYVPINLSDMHSWFVCRVETMGYSAKRLAAAWQVGMCVYVSVNAGM